MEFKIGDRVNFINLKTGQPETKTTYIVDRFTNNGECNVVIVRDKKKPRFEDYIHTNIKSLVIAAENRKYKIGDIVTWHRPWFTKEMDMRVKIIGQAESKQKGNWYIGIFHEMGKNVYDGKNMFKENELFTDDELPKTRQLKYEQLTLF